jgi:PAS domain S-box-containing protein
MLLHGEDLLDAIRTAMEKIETEHIHDVARFNDQANEVQVYSNLVIAGGTILGLLIFLITMLRLNTVESRQNALLANNLRLTNLYAALTQCNQAIVRCTSDDELFKEICRITVEFGKMKLAWIGITDPESGLLNRVACSGTAMDYLQDLQVSVNPDLPESHGPTGTAIRENRPYWCENFQTDPATIPWRERAQRHGVGGAASLPLSRNGKVFGALIVYTDGSYKFDQSIKDLLVEMADDIGFAINNYANENQLRIASIAFESHEGMLIADATTRIQSVNQALTRITGYSTEDVIGKKPSILSSGRQDASFYFSMWQSIRTTGGWQGKIWNKRKNGEVFPALLSINCVKDKNGIVTHYVGALADITENEKTLEALRLASINLELANQQVNEERALLAQRVLERTVQLMMANRAKDSFLATMSHEIRTPLGGLLGMLELLGLSQLNANQKVMVQTARKSGKGLLRILNDILDWSKIEAGKLELVPSPATISDTIKGVVSTYSVLASEKGIQILVEIDPQLSNAHIFDTLRVSQILNNFTSNAIKFTERGNIVIRANLVAQQLGHEEVQFSVKDSGVGISPELHQRIFQQFEQASAETARMYGGTGLGLAICLKLAEMMGGRLSVESVSGLGATFSFFVSFPVANQAAQLKIQHSSQDEDQTGWPDISRLGSPDSPYTILIVDDHPVNRMLLKQQLEVLGIHTESAANGSSALPLWLNGHFDLIITDCHMPEIDGYELTRRIREAEQQTAAKHIPIIAWTANVLAEEADRCHAAGMNDLLTKPTELAELRKKLLKWLPKASESSTGKYPAYVPSESAIETAIDFNILKKFAVSRPAQVEMLRIFLTQNRIDMGNLRAILKDGDPTEVAQMAHRIKGASRMVGAKELEEICSTIETACKQNDMPAMQTNVAKLDETMVRIETAILRFTDG